MHPALQRRVSEVDTGERAVIATEPDGRIVYWNERAELLYGWTAGEAIGKDIVEVTPGELALSEANEIMNALNRGQPWSGEFLVRAKNGARFTVHVTDMPVLDEDRNLLGIVGISRRVVYLNE
ncbi:MAG TPA: PAS domain-containing protein [Longimicrobiales bacterium]|nr:PAS domain-containing protein [Longimicrobiales bacterium]